ncbi:hypothetical protein D3C72_1966210 [compost metagenome]
MMLAALAIALYRPACASVSPSCSISSTGRKVNSAKNIKLYSVNDSASSTGPAAPSVSAVSCRKPPQDRLALPGVAGASAATQASATTTAAPAHHQYACQWSKACDASIATAMPAGI